VHNTIRRAHNRNSYKDLCLAQFDRSWLRRGLVMSRTTARPRRPAGEAERSFSNIEIKTFAAAGC